MSADRIWQFDIILSDGFVLTEISAVLETLRIANRVLAKPAFSWRLRSAEASPVACRSGLFVDTIGFDPRPDADFAFVLGNTDPAHPGLSLANVIRSYTSRGAQVYLLAEAAARHIRDTDGDDSQHTTHWENLDLLREQSGLRLNETRLASQIGPIVTCAGMGATTDVVLGLVGTLTSAAVQMTVANILLHEQIRDLSSQQPNGIVNANLRGDDVLQRAVALMQVHIEEPLSIELIAKRLGLSSRALERRFKARLGTTPNGFYRELRLSKANNLLVNTSLSVREIGLACGFPNGFSSLYKAAFGMTPIEVRRVRNQN